LNRKLFGLIVGAQLVFCAAMLLSVQLQTAKALVPNVVSVDFYDVGTVKWVNVTVFHAPPPALGTEQHFVSVIDLDVNGTVQSLPRLPQTTETFSFVFSLGENVNTYSVRARALCNIHGYSAWSTSATIPESIAPAIFIVLATISLVTAKKALGQSASSIVPR